MPIMHPMHIWNQLGLQVLVPSSIQKSLHFGFHFLLWVHVLQLLWRAKLTRKCQKSLCYEFTSLQLVYKKARFCGSADISSHECWILTFLHERSHVFAHLSLRCWPYPLWIRLHHCQPWVQWVAASKAEHVMLRACNHVKLSNYETERIWKVVAHSWAMAPHIEGSGQMDVVLEYEWNVPCWSARASSRKANREACIV